MKNKILLARRLRRNQTPSEAFLWSKLRNRQLNGFKFLRQHPYVYNQEEQRFFILDFYCAEKKLAIELDGGIHAYQEDDDCLRDSILKEMGIDTLRLKNESLDNIAETLNCILQVLYSL